MGTTATVTADTGKSNKIGLTAATFMVAGNMMGSGVFMLPANLATTGGIALFGWLVTCVGTVALALVFSKLAQIDPAAGGPYAYARKAFGDYTGFQTNLVYWLANVVGNVGLAVAGLGYLSIFYPALKIPLVSAFGQIAVIWFFTFANILGPKMVGRMQSVTTIFALVPILGVAFLGWFWFHPHLYAAGWNVSGKSTFSAIGATLNFTLWAFIGVETASVSAAVVDNPRRNIPIATIGGVILAAVAYILSSTVIMGMIPNKALIASSAPFADAVSLALGPMAGYIVAGCAAIGCLGSLAGWTLLVGQTAKAAADDGLFPGIFAKINKRSVPSAGLAIVAVIMTVQVLATISPTASQQFGKIASIAVIMTLLPYIYSAISIKVLGWHHLGNREYSIFVMIGIVAAVYCLWALVGSDGEQTRWALIFVISTIVFYTAVITRRREIEESHLRPGGPAPSWVRYAVVGMTILALVLMFWFSVGNRSDLHLFTRSPLPISQVSSAPTHASP